MHADEDQEMMDVNQLGLSRDEAQELRAQLDAEAWQALLSLQHALANAPVLAPSAGFADRVLQTLAVRERRRAQRRSLIGIISFALGSIFVTALLFLLSPLGVMTQASGWAALLDSALQLVGFATTWLVIVRAFIAAFVHATGEPGLVLLALLALALTLAWAQMIVESSPLDHSIHATEAL
jgi:hypothetical protein